MDQNNLFIKQDNIFNNPSKCWEHAMLQPLQDSDIKKKINNARTMLS